MDSITQIVLGASVGEAVLGKKVGNRAMMWGAVGGTVPDLDIMANFFTDEMTALAFHRGFMHSFVFAAIAPFLFGWLTYKFYQSGIYRKYRFKQFAMGSWILLAALIGIIINYLPLALGGGLKFGLLVGTCVVLVLFAWTLWNNYYRTELEVVTVGWKDWTWLFFWAIFTHPVLDGFTAFGTQWYQPFSDYRVAFNNISVVDPLYTLPFLICLVIAAWHRKDTSRRSFFNYLGLSLSTAYIIFTFYNKGRVDEIFENSYNRASIAYERYMTAPTIFNNILWMGMAESDTTYYHGLYSFFDPTQEVGNFVTIPKNHHLLEGHEKDRSVRILTWFSNGYYNVIRRNDGRLQFNDLRFGGINESFKDENDYVFRFILEDKNGKLVAHQTREGNDISGRAFRQLWNRIMGRSEALRK